MNLLSRRLFWLPGWIQPGCRHGRQSVDTPPTNQQAETGVLVKSRSNTGWIGGWSVFGLWLATSGPLELVALASFLINYLSADASMNTESSPTASRFDPVPVDLKNRGLAAMLAWLWPGAGHAYQGRYGKAVLFMVCILVTYFWGLAMGDGHVVYASFRKQDMRYEYLLQMHVGLPALPALAQNFIVKGGGDPLFGGKMAPPILIPGENHESTHDQKAEWHGKLGFFFELGSLFTMVAGLLNLLAVFDAFSGPGFTLPESQTRQIQADQSGSGMLYTIRESFGGALETGAMILGVVAAMTIKYRLEDNNRWMSYLYAIGGGFAGFYVARALNRAIGSVFDSIFGTAYAAGENATDENAMTSNETTNA